MKIIVIGTPRTATSVTCELISKKFELANLEYISNHISRFIKDRNKEIDCFSIETSIADSLLSMDNFVIKYVGGCVAIDSLSAFQKQLNFFSQFDKIIFCSRDSLSDQFRSWLFLQKNISGWVTAIKEEMRNQIEKTHPEILNWNFESQEQIAELVKIYRPMYTVVKKQVRLDPIEIPKHKIDPVGFRKQIRRFRLYKSTLTEQCPDKCCEISYEMWQQPEDQIAHDLSNALGVNIDLQDLKALNNQKNQIEYSKLITNLEAVDSSLSLINITKDMI